MGTPGETSKRIPEGNPVKIFDKNQDFLCKFRYNFKIWWPLGVILGDTVVETPGKRQNRTLKELQPKSQ